MAKNELFIDAPPQAVWAVLADPNAFGYWVVGSSEIRAAEGSWPQPGSLFHHRIGWGPLKVSDHTRVEQSEEPKLLTLKAKARPFGTALVILQLIPEGAGTRVTMVEDPGDSLTAIMFSPITHLFVKLRNSEALKRLAKLAVRQHEAPVKAKQERKKFAKPQYG